MKQPEGRELLLRIAVPASGRVQGVYLDIPGGGFYLGSAAAGDARNAALADALGIAVVCVDYRLAPEEPWPAAPDDCETAALWLLDRAGAGSVPRGWRSAAAPPAPRWP